MRVNGYGFQIDSNCAQTARALIKKRRSRRCLEGSASCASPVISGMLIPIGTAHARKIISSLLPWFYSEFRLLRRGSSWPFSCFSLYHSTLLFIRSLYRSGMISHKIPITRFIGLYIESFVIVTRDYCVNRDCKKSIKLYSSSNSFCAEYFPHF